MIDYSKVIEIATREIGYRENPPGTNRNKYAADIDTNHPKWYWANGPHKKDGFDWCTIFHDWCYIQAYTEDVARGLLYRPENNYGAGVKYSWEYYRAAGATSTVPVLGGSIYFTRKEGREYPTHIGIVTGFTETSVTAIEGNAGAASEYVVEKTYKRNDPYIYGYGRPLFDADPKSPYKKGSLYRVTCKDTLNIRESPTTEARRISADNPGTIIQCEDVILDKNGNTWLKVSAYMCAIEGGAVYIS